MWAPDPRMTAVSEEDERSSIFRRPSRRPPYGAQAKRRGSLPRSPLSKQAHMAVSTARNSRRISLESGASLASSSGSDLLAMSSYSAATNTSTRGEISNQVDSNFVNTVNGVLRQPIARFDMLCRRPCLGFALRKAIGIDKSLKKVITPQDQEERLSVVKITVFSLTDTQEKLDDREVYCLCNVGPTATSAVPDGEEDDVPRSFTVMIARTRLVEPNTLSNGATWRDSFELCLPYTKSELACMAVHCYVWSTERNGQWKRSGIMDRPTVVFSNNAIDEPLVETDVLIGNVCVPFQSFLSRAVPASQAFALRQQTADVVTGALSIRVEATSQTAEESSQSQLQCLISLAWENALLVTTLWRRDHGNRDVAMLVDVSDSVRLLVSQCSLRWSVGAVKLAAMHLLAACELCEDHDEQLPPATITRLVGNLNCLLDSDGDVETLEHVSSVSDFHLGVGTIYDMAVAALEDDIAIFPPDDKSLLTSARVHIELMLSLDRLRLKTGVLKSSGVASDVLMVLQNAVLGWYGGDDIFPDDLNDETDEVLLGILSEMQDVWREAVEICSKLRQAEQHSAVFSVIGIGYVAVILRAMSTMLEPDLKAVMTVVSTRLSGGKSGAVVGQTAAASRQDSSRDKALKSLDSMAMQSFRLYVVMDHFCRKSGALLAKSGVTRPLLDNRHLMFTGCVSAWITAVERGTGRKVATIVKTELDRVRTGLLKETVGDCGASASARETVDLIEEVVNSYWRPLQSWPQLVVAYTASVGLADVLAAACLQYCVELLLALRDVGFFTTDASGGIDISLHGCVFLCNIHYALNNGVEKQLLEQTKPLGQQRPGAPRAVPFGQQGGLDQSLDTQLSAVLDKVVVSLREDLYVRLKATFVDALNGIRPIFHNDVLELVKVTHKYTIDLAAQVVQPLLLHCSQLISQLICCSAPQAAFDCFLECLWGLCISCVHGTIKARLAKGMSREHCQLAYDAVKILYGFYEDCTERISLNTPQFKGLMRGLELAQFTTEQLILHYCYLDCEEQDKANKEDAAFGKFRLRPFLEYRKSRLTLSINVVDCSDVNVFNAISGSGDVCLRLELCPRHLFAGNMSLFSARIGSKTDQKFHMKITFPIPESCEQVMRSGMLHLSLVHREWWGIYETTIAQAVAPLHSMRPPSPGASNPAQSQQPPSVLHLTMPTSHHSVVQVLQSRAKGEKLAQEFLQWHTKKLERKDAGAVGTRHAVDEFDLFV